ncbi:MAG TPA: S8 family serine peptidase [Chthoniobacterales bacterium]|nr:S8 family serine peptidase [Chthoniobacterales bacterium]
MIKFRFGGKTGRSFNLKESPSHIVVRTANRMPLTSDQVFAEAPLSRGARAVVGEFDLVARFLEAGVEVLRVARQSAPRALRDHARSVLKKDPAIEFVGRVLTDSRSGEPVLYTENFFVKFDGDISQRACLKIIKSYNLEIKRTLEYARNAYFIQAAEGTGQKIFAIAERLLNEKNVELCHPELVRRKRSRGAFNQQWHLKSTSIGGQVVNQHANVESAWALTDGTGTIIAVIDDGVDLEHEEFRSSGKIIAPRDVGQQNDNPRPRSRDNHGTACSGVACGDGNFGASGVAPRARLIPIRSNVALGSQAEADAFVWAAQNGADVISCSWGPPDGDFEDASDPLHRQVVPLPDSTRLAIDFATQNGRGGKGCVVLFAAGNGNESVDNDGYASYAKVIAVAACDDTGKKAPYSDFGRAVWCSFPSNHYYQSVTPGIWTTDRMGGPGYNPGDVNDGDAAGNYTNNFGGTSSACPGAAGVAALVIARNPTLRGDEVREILRNCCDRIDAAGGGYDATGRSLLYGYGRLNARKAVELALPPQPNAVAIRTARQDVPIQDLKTSRLTLAVADTQPVKSLKVTVDIDHTYIGDLLVTLKPPTTVSSKRAVLHNRTEASKDNLKRTYDVVNAPDLAQYLNKKPTGTWTLAVADKEKADTGMIRSFTLEIGF